MYWGPSSVIDGSEHVSQSKRQSRTSSLAYKVQSSKLLLAAMCTKELPGQGSASAHSVVIFG